MGFAAVAWHRDPMRVLVTGASGFIGRRLLETLAIRGDSGVAISRNPPPVPRGWQSAARSEWLRSSGHQPDCQGLVHLEVKQHVPHPTARDQAELTHVNVGGTMQWLDWATRNGILRFVYVSSVKAVRAGDDLTHEDADPETSDPYGRSKAEAEAAVREWAAAAADRTAVILRFAPVYGPNNQANLAAFTKQIILGRPSLAGDGQAKKSILSRENAVQAVYHALHQIHARCEVFNVADSQPIALCDLASLIAGCCNAPPPRRIPRLLAVAIARAGDAFEALTGREFVLDSRRLRVLLSDSVFPIDKLLRSGFVPQQSTADGIAEMAVWVRDQGR